MKLPLLPVLLLGTAFSLSGCYTLLLGGAAGAGGYYVAKDERPVKGITSDAAITGEIKSKFVADDLVSAMDINVDTYNGVVTLTGYVPNQAVIGRAIQIAQQTEGVRQVVPQLRVNPRY